MKLRELNRTYCSTSSGVTCEEDDQSDVSQRFFQTRVTAEVAPEDASAAAADAAADARRHRRRQRMFLTFAAGRTARLTHRRVQSQETISRRTHFLFYRRFQSFLHTKKKIKETEKLPFH